MVKRWFHLRIHLEVRLKGVGDVNLHVESPLIRVVKLRLVILVEESLPPKLISNFSDFALIILFCDMKI